MKFTNDTVLASKKELFLANPENKQRFADCLWTYLKGLGCVIIHAEGDADTEILQTAVNCTSKTVAVIGEDTDLLVLLCFHTKHTDPDQSISCAQTDQTKNILCGTSVGCGFNLVMNFVPYSLSYMLYLAATQLPDHTKLEKQLLSKR